MHKYANLLGSFENKNKSEPTFCIITPVFDPALISLKKLIKDLKRQTYKNFIHAMVSNGQSPKIEKYVTSLQKKDSRFIFIITKAALTPDFASIKVDSGKRRDYCLRNCPAQWYQFLDADLSIIDTGYFAKLYMMQKVIKTNIMLVKTKYHGNMLPANPINVEGNISLANYCFSKKIANQYRYPTNYKAGDWGNDFKYWMKISKNEKVTSLNFIATTEGDDRTYKRMSDSKIEETLGKELISVFGNSFAVEDLAGLDEVMQSHRVGYGEVTRSFENAFSDYIGFRYGVATNSCTNAFWILLKTLKFSANEEVIIPSIHFFGIRNILELLNIKYKIVDVDEGTPNLNIEHCKKLITANTKAIIALDYGGYPFEIKKLKAYLKKIGRQDIYLILDAANSPFTQLNNKYVAREYHYALYSFDMNKVLVTGDGGMILSNNKTNIEKCRTLSYYGIADTGKSGFAKSSTSKEWWRVGMIDPSMKLAMNNLAATLGVSQLAKIKTNLSGRENIRQMYYKKLRQLVADGHITLPPNNARVTNATYLFWLIVKDKQTRDNLTRFLLRKNIYSTVKYEPLGTKKATPLAWDFFECSICIPLNQNLHEQIVDYIVSQLLDFFYEK